MIYPGNWATLKTETFFIEGIKFDICEVHPSHYEYLPVNGNGRASKPASRFFLAVEDTHVVNYKFSEQYHKATGDCRWDFFCMGRAECLQKIKDFEKRLAQISRLKLAKLQETRERLNKLRISTNEMYGTNL